jgi:hypothetical protein
MDGIRNSRFGHAHGHGHERKNILITFFRLPEGFFGPVHGPVPIPSQRQIVVAFPGPTCPIFYSSIEFNGGGDRFPCHRGSLKALGRWFFGYR